MKAGIKDIKPTLLQLINSIMEELIMPHWYFLKPLCLNSFSLDLTEEEMEAVERLNSIISNSPPQYVSYSNFGVLSSGN